MKKILYAFRDELNSFACEIPMPNCIKFTGVYANFFEPNINAVIVSTTR